MTTFVRYPSTPYLLRPTGLDIRDDKVLTERERATFMSRSLHVEEKVDGENLGISSNGESLQFQARGSYVSLGGRRFRGVESWVRPRQRRIEQAVGTDLIVFGEWCATEHNVRYDRLPDWFLMFDVYDRSTGEFWDTALRDELANDLGLCVVPFLGAGRFTEAELLDLIGASRLGHERMEGIVARVQGGAGDIPRAKVVRPDFIERIGEHWMSRSRPTNQLDSQSGVSPR